MRKLLCLSVLLLFPAISHAQTRGGSGSYPERIVRYRDASPEALKEKVQRTVND